MFKNLNSKSAFLILLLLIATSSFSQSISINEIHSQDTIFNPFPGIDSITGLKVSGSIVLNSDSSLIRLIYVDDVGNEFMILESYPLINSQNDFSFSQYCDETCFLNYSRPEEIAVQVIDASFQFDTLYYSTNSLNNPDSLQFEAKKLNDSIKIEQINNNSQQFNLEYTAGGNFWVNLFYKDKKIVFGEKYNLIGYDYYAEGIYKLPWDNSRTTIQTDLVPYFDWRNRHGATSPESDYYDGDPNGSGWMTIVKNQNTCGSCYAFASVGVLEASANLYFNQHLDFNLSEQDLVCNLPGGGCDGAEISDTYNYLKNPGVRTEECFPYHDTDNPVTCNLLNNNCNNPDTLVKINGILSVDATESELIIEKLIKKGPQTVTLFGGTAYHAVVLTGYIIDPVDQSIIWIYKESGGESFGDHGFIYSRIPPRPTTDNYFIKTPIYIDTESSPERFCCDEDGDGFYNWGIGSAPEGYNEDDFDCDDNDPLVGKYDENTFHCSCNLDYIVTPIQINAIATWPDETILQKDVIINPGGHLTISNIVRIVPEAKIIIKPGGKLTIDGGTLTKACVQNWKGVEVWGDPSKSQFNETDQGIIIIKNEGSIQYAEIGILTGKIQNDVFVEGFEGGIIFARNSSFNNNTNDILFKPYQNIHPYNPNQEVNNFSYFTACDFTTDYLACMENKLPGAHVSLYDVKGIEFKGCSFKNTFPVEGVNFVEIPEEGTGILAFDASVIVLPEFVYPDPLPDPCNECYEVVPCTFENLRHGIKAFNTAENNKIFNVQNSTFTNNFSAIYLSCFNQPSILSNSFTSELDVNFGDQEDPFWGGIYLEECSGYHIEGNEFVGNYNPNAIVENLNWNIGIYVKNSGPMDNEIYRNSFDNLIAGIVAEGENRDEQTTGLCIKCNQMQDNLNDFLVVESEIPEGDPFLGIKIFQGSMIIQNDAPAGNTFTEFSSPAQDFGGYDKKYYNYFNDALQFTYIHHLEQLFPVQTYPTEDNYSEETITLVEQVGLTYTESTACPSKLDNNQYKNGYDPKTQFDFANTQLILYRSELDALIDGGDTEGLNFDVLTSIPDEALEIKQDLLNESPYLSDTVMKQTIFKEDVLPNAMVRDVLVNNPQAAKSKDVLNMIENRFVPMPEYMMAEIMQGRNYLGQKEILESKMAYWSSKKENAKNQLIRKYISDTNLINPIDSIIALYDNEISLHSRYQLAQCYLINNEFVEAQNVLNDIPYSFNLSVNQAARHLDFESYYSLLQQMYDSCWNIYQLDSSYMSSLVEIYENNYPLVHGLARGLLSKGNYLNYFEQVELPSTVKSYPVYDNIYQDEEIPENHNLHLFPNPTFDYIIIEFDLPSQKNSFNIVISDITGRTIKSIPLFRKKDQITLNLRDFSNGIYIVSLYDYYKLIESKKFTKKGK